MTTTDRSRIIDRVRKLMAFNDHTATEAEVENAMSLAARLMEQHAIDRADVAMAGGPEGAPAEIRTRSRSPLAANVARWEALLANAVRQAVPGVSHYTDVDEARTVAGASFPRQSHVVWYGPDDTVAVARLVFDETRMVIATLAAGMYGGCYRGAGRSYAEGFAVALQHRVHRDREASEDRARVTAIVRRDDERNAAWLAEEHDISLVSRRRSGGGRHHPSAYTHGHRDGERHEFTGIRPRIDDAEG